MSSHDDILRLAQSHADRREFNEALALVEEVLVEVNELERDSVEGLRYYFEIERSKHLDELVAAASRARDAEDWSAATRILDEARTLDGEGNHQGIRSLTEQVAQLEQQSLEAARDDSKRRAAEQLGRAGTVGEIENVVQVLEELIAKKLDDLEVRELLEEAQERRRMLLAKAGKITTLEQNSQFDELLTEFEDLIQQGFREMPATGGQKARDIFEYRAEIEARAQAFAEDKAGRYWRQGEQALGDGKLELALTYVQKGLDLKAIPQERRDDLEDLRLSAEQAKGEREALAAAVSEATELMNREGDFDGAIHLLEGVLAQDSKHTAAASNLHRARRGLETQALKQVRRGLSKATARLNQDPSGAREQLELAGETLDGLGGSDEVEALRRRQEELTLKLDASEGLERETQRAEGALRRALRSKAFAEAEDLLQALSSEARKDPRISSLRSTLSRQQDVEAATAGIRQALDDEDFVGARKQMVALKRRQVDHAELVELGHRVDASFYYNKGTEALEAGDLTAAKRSLNRVRKLGDMFADEADEALERLAQRQEREKREKKLLRQAAKHFDLGRFEEAHGLLATIQDDLGVANKELLQLRAKVDKGWRRQLTKSIRGHLEGDAFEDAYEAANKLASLKLASDTKVVAEARCAYLVHRAQIAARGSDWSAARDLWSEAETHDPTSEKIADGLREAKLRAALQEAATTRDAVKRLAVLESVFDLHAPDSEVFAQLSRELVRAEEYRRAIRLADLMLTRPDNELRIESEQLRELCQLLQECADLSEQGSHRRSLDHLETSRERFPMFEGALDAIQRQRRKAAVDRLWNDAQRLEREGQPLAHKLPLYRELLEVQPDHRDAERRNKELLEDLDHEVQDLLHEAKIAKEEANAPPDQIDDKIRQIEVLLKVANHDQVSKLQHWRKELNGKRRDLRTFDEKSRLLLTLLVDAKATGDFQVVEGLQADLANLVSNRYQGAVDITRQLRQAKETRRRVEKLRANLQEAFDSSDFVRLEQLANELLRTDVDDEYKSREDLHLIDPWTKIDVAVDELSEWAQERQANRNALATWLEEQQINPGPLEEQERELRERKILAHDRKVLIKGLRRLSDHYHEAAEGLREPPQKPLSQAASKVIDTSRAARKTLLDRAERLGHEVRRLQDGDEEVADLIAQAADLIDNNEFAAARPVIEQGLEIVPDHAVLLHFLGIVDRG